MTRLTCARGCTLPGQQGIRREAQRTEVERVAKTSHTSAEIEKSAHHYNGDYLITHLLVNQWESFEPTVQYSVYEGKIKVEGEEDRVRKVEFERLEQSHLGNLLRRHLGLLDFRL
jgi:hypothetical protein